MAEFNVPEVNASGEFVSPLVKSHVQKLALSVSGPGRPDQVATTQGAITGSEPVGTTYTSTDGANVGAYVWRKRPGGKWEVVDGDTGWRVIFNGTTVLEPTWAPITTPSAGRLRLRRTVAGLWVSADDIQFPSGTATQFSMLGGLDSAWQVSADTRTYPGGFYVLGGQQPALRVDRSDLIGNPVGGRIRDIKFYPSSSWPSAPLPGTPA